MKEFRIMGPPGTGKTTKLSGEIAVAAEKHGASNVLVMSFTKAAASELRGRKLQLPRENVGTMHSVCWNLLGGPKIVTKHVDEFNKKHPNFAVTGEDDTDDLMFEYNTGNNGDDLLKWMDNLRQRMVPRELWPLTVQRFASAWEQFKLDSDTVDYTDLIERAFDAREFAPGNPRVIFMDECQDSTKLELSLLRKWGQHAEFFVTAGDDDQCIYGFRGARPEAFLHPEIPENQVKVLGHSYRLPRQVWQYAERWVGRIPDRYPKVYNPRDHEGIVRISHYFEYQKPEDFVREIEEKIAQGKSVMILATCAYMLRATAAMLRSRGVPFHNPYKHNKGDWNPLGRRKGLSSPDRMITFLQMQLDQDPQPWTWSQIKAWAEPLSSSAMPNKARAINAADVNGEAVASPDLILDTVGRDALEAAERGDVSWYYRNVIKSKQKVFEFPMNVIKRAGVAGLKDHYQVQGVPGKGLIIGTIHSVKGGEADVVYLFPDMSFAGYSEFQNPKTKNNAMRQFYVAITRAREELVLCHHSSDLSIDWIPTLSGR